MKISDMNPTEAAANLYTAYMNHHNAIASGDAEGPHPSKDVSRWRAAAAGAPVEGEIQKGQDDQQPENSATLPNSNGSKPAQDAAFQLEEHRLLTNASGSADPAGALAVFRAKQSDPAATARMAKALGPSYNRLR